MEYTNTFEDEARKHWYELLCYYHATTEQYDRALTDIRSPFDPTEAWINGSPIVQKLSNVFARRCWNDVLDMARELNIPSYIINEDRFGNKYHYSAQRWIDEYERIQKENGIMKGATMKKIYAVCETLEAGYPREQEQFQKSGIKVGDKFLLTDVSMGQSYTSVCLDGNDDLWFNSVFFNFVDEDGNDYNIFKDPNFNPYL